MSIDSADAKLIQLSASSSSSFTFATPYPPTLSTAPTTLNPAQTNTTPAAAEAGTATTNSSTTTTNSTGSQLTLKQRRVSLALPNSPRLVPAWSFRDDTAVDAPSAAGSPLVSTQEKKTKAQRKSASIMISSTDMKAVVQDKPPGPVPEKRPRKKWSEEETQMLVTGCNIVRLLLITFYSEMLILYCIAL